MTDAAQLEAQREAQHLALLRALDEFERRAGVPPWRIQCTGKTWQQVKACAKPWDISTDGVVTRFLGIRVDVVADVPEGRWRILPREVPPLAIGGAGGGILASHLLGWRTVCAVERESYARDVLLARQRDGILRPFPIWDDVRTFDGRPWRGAVDVVSGGFPCTDISIARAMWGRDGINGEASGLWFEYLRIVDETEPAYVWGENSPELRAKGLSSVVESLAGRGFLCRWATIGAADVGLPHKRQRLWFLATHPDRARLERHPRDGAGTEGRKDPHRPPAHAAVFVCPGCGNSVERDAAHGCAHCLGAGAGGVDQRPGLQPGIAGMAYGVADRVERLTAIGNGQVPAVAAAAFRYLSAPHG